MKTLRNALITGMLVLLPLLATIEVMWWFVRTVDNSMREYLPTGLLPVDFPGLGLLIAIILVFGMGVLTQNYVGKLFVSRFDKLLGKLPFAGGLYSAIKQFLETIFNPKKGQFKEAVMVEFPRKGMRSIGFLTGEPDEKLIGSSKEKMINVFVPCTPNPTSGFYLVVPENSVEKLDMPVHDAFRILISMGVVKSEEEEAK